MFPMFLGVSNVSGCFPKKLDTMVHVRPVLMIGRGDSQRGISWPFER